MQKTNESTQIKTYFDPNKKITCTVLEKDPTEINCSKPIIDPVIIFYISIIMYTVILGVGISTIKKAISQNFKDFLKEKNSKSNMNNNKISQDDMALLTNDPKNSDEMELLIEKAINQEDKSFSRLAGAIGSMGLSSLFIGVGYWVIYTLFSGGNLDELKGLGKYFLAGSALFVPYAFNQLKTIFN